MRQSLNSRCAPQALCIKRVWTAESSRAESGRVELARYFLPRIVHQTKNTIRAATAKASR
jgi:hypothetical protein